MLFTAEVAKSKQLSSEEGRVSSSGFDRLQQSRSVIPAVTHVDNSARVQTVNKANGDFYKLLKAFYQLTGCPVLINTSFNIMDEPIVCSPVDAVKCFQGTDMDVLAFKNIIIYKHENQQTQANKLQKKYWQSTVMS
jgi:carbamoyltransferase